MYWEMLKLRYYHILLMVCVAEFITLLWYLKTSKFWYFCYFFYGGNCSEWRVTRRGDLRVWDRRGLQLNAFFGADVWKANLFFAARQRRFNQYHPGLQYQWQHHRNQCHVLSEHSFIEFLLPQPDINETGLCDAANQTALRKRTDHPHFRPEEERFQTRTET